MKLTLSFQGAVAEASHTEAILWIRKGPAALRSSVAIGLCGGVAPGQKAVHREAQGPVGVHPLELIKETWKICETQKMSSSVLDGENEPNNSLDIFC